MIPVIFQEEHDKSLKFSQHIIYIYTYFCFIFTFLPEKD